MQSNWTGKITNIFVSNSRLSLLLILALFVWGFLSYTVTPKQYNPKITAPAFQITVNFPGVSRREILEQVTRPLENIISDIPQVEDIFSTTYNGGRAIIVANFYVGEDPEYAKITLTDRINSNFNEAPLGIQPPLVQSIDPDDVPILTMALRSDQIDQIALRKLAFRVRDRIGTIEGTSNIEVLGGRRRELGIDIDPARMAATGIGMQAIIQALERQNLYLPAGYIKGQESYIPVEVHSTVSSPADLRDIVVVTGDFGQTRLRDVATIVEHVEEIEEYVRHVYRDEKGRVQSTEHVVLLSVAKHSDANSGTVTSAIKDKLDSLQKNFLPPHITAEILVNEGRVAREEISRLVSNLVSAILIVVAILLVFLDRRAAFLVSVSIPLTLAMVFGIGQLAGQNINRITLFALILSLGLLVDNATVVIENIVRWVRQNPDRKKLPLNDLIVTAVSEVGPGLVMSTITTVLAFIPMAFVGGMMGPYMGPIPFFVPAAIIVSLFISLSLNPFMASIFLRSAKPAHTSQKSFTWIPVALRNLLQKLGAFGDTVFSYFRGLLHNLLINKKQSNIMLIIIASLLVACFALPAVKLVKFRMLPKADREQFFLYIDLPAGTPLHETRRVALAYEQLLMKQKEIKMVQSFIGRPPIIDFNGLFRGVSARAQSDQATLRVGLTHPETRDTKSTSLVMHYRGILEKAKTGISPTKEIKLKLVEDPPGPPVMSTLLVRIQGYDEKLLNQIADDIYPQVEKEEQVVDTDISTPEDHQSIQIYVDQVRASRSRISAAQIVSTLRTAYNGKQVGLYHNNQNIEQEYITLRLGREHRLQPESLRKIVLYNDLGIKVPLSDLVRIENGIQTKPLQRENKRHTVYIYGDMGDRSITYAAIDLLYYLADYTLPDGKGELVSWSLFGMQYRTPDDQLVEISLGGEWELTLEVFRDLGTAMGVAIFLIYFVLVAQFGSFREPLVIMSTIPLSLIGVLPGFMILGSTIGLYFNATSMIGVIALAGIAVNNSIILLEYLNGLKNTGLDLESALVEAGVTRFRPIMLTTFTTILGSFTIVSDPVWSGLAWAIIFGLGVSSVLTLLVFPILYSLLKGKDWEK